MKFFCSLLLMAVAASASAVDMSDLKASVPARKSLQKLDSKTILRRAPRAVEATAASPFDGTYYMGLGDYYFQSSVGAVTIEVNMAVSGDSIIISDPSKEWLTVPVRAAFNAETGVISFSNYILFNDGGEVDVFAPFRYDTVAEDLVFTNFDITYDAATSSFVIPAEHGFSWPAWTGANALENAEKLDMASVRGWYGVFDLESLEGNRDYELTATTDYVCPLGDKIEVNLTAGSDIAAVYYIGVRGRYSAAEGTNAELTKQYGDPAPATSPLTLATPDESGLYSIMVAGVNATGRVVANATTYQVINNDSDANWQPVLKTKTTMTEGLISNVFGLDAEEIEVELEQDLKNPGRFRFESPYKKHSVAHGLTFVDVKNYIYVNATDYLRVYVEPSALGFTVGEYGAPYVFSWPALTAGTPDFEKENPNDFGRYYNGVISVPTVTSFNNEPYDFDAPTTLTLTLTDSDAIEEISADGHAGNAIYDLMGRRVASGARGLLIVNGVKAIRK